MKPFWERKTLEQMTRKEWESLCDGCGRCCLWRFSDPDFGTDVACRLLDLNTGQCGDYKNRVKQVDDCEVLTPAMVRQGWLPATCGYRLVEEGHGLYWWHPLVSGDPDTVRAAGIAVTAHRCRSELEFKSQEEIEARERKWPEQWPSGSKRKPYA